MNTTEKCTARCFHIEKSDSIIKLKLMCLELAIATDSTLNPLEIAKEYFDWTTEHMESLDDLHHKARMTERDKRVSI